MSLLKKVMSQINAPHFDAVIDNGAEMTPQSQAVKSDVISGISNAPDGFEASPLTSNLFGLVGEQSERFVSNRQVIPADPTVDPSMLFNYFTDIQKPAPPVPTEGGDQSLKPLGLPGDAIDKGEVALEDAVVTVGVATEDVGVAIGDAAEWVAGAVGDVAEEVDSALNTVTDGKFGEATKAVGNFAEARFWDVFRATEDVGIAFGDAGKWTAGAVEDAVGAVDDVLNSVTDGKFGEVVSDVGNGIVQTFQQVGSGDVGGAAGVAAGWTLEAVEDLAKAAAAAAEKAAKAAEEAAKAAAKAAADAAAAVAEAAEDAINEVGEVLEDVGEGVGDVASDVGDFIGDLW